MANVEGDYVQVDGIDKLVKSFAKIDTDLKKKLQDKLRAIAKDIVVLVKGEAISKGLGAPGLSGRGTGKLVDSVKDSVRGGSAYIRETALRDGYKYPAIYEYGRNSRWQKRGVRSFIAPVIDREHDHVEQEIEALLDYILSDDF